MFHVPAKKETKIIDDTIMGNSFFVRFLQCTVYSGNISIAFAIISAIHFSVLMHLQPEIITHFFAKKRENFMEPPAFY